MTKTKQNKNIKEASKHNVYELVKRSSVLNKINKNFKC